MCPLHKEGYSYWTEGQPVIPILMFLIEGCFIRSAPLLLYIYISQRESIPILLLSYLSPG